MVMRGPLRSCRRMRCLSRKCAKQCRFARPRRVLVDDRLKWLRHFVVSPRNRTRTDPQCGFRVHFRFRFRFRFHFRFHFCFGGGGGGGGGFRASAFPRFRASALPRFRASALPRFPTCARSRTRAGACACACARSRARACARVCGCACVGVRVCVGAGRRDDSLRMGVSVQSVLCRIYAPQVSPIRAGRRVVPAREKMRTVGLRKKLLTRTAARCKEICRSSHQKPFCRTWAFVRRDDSLRRALLWHVGVSYTFTVGLGLGRQRI